MYKDRLHHRNWMTSFFEVHLMEQNASELVITNSDHLVHSMKSE